MDANVLRQTPTDTLYEIRGGYWFVDNRKAVCLPDSGYQITSHPAKHSDLGFRCCRGQSSASPPPREEIIQCPDDMVSLTESCIDRYEFPNIQGSSPLINATFTVAKQACKQQGKHLCSDTEWLEACTNQGTHRWPYGNTYLAETCNDHGWVESEIHGIVAKSGSYDNCVTPNGVYDLSGNLWEWTEKSNGGRLRGGGWELSAGLGQCRSFSDPGNDYHAGEVGFRCCATPIESKRLLED